MRALALVAVLAACTEIPDDGQVSEAVTACAGSTVEGVDVSDQQGAIAWAAARAAGVQWAAIKATQGTYNTQSTFAANWANARAAGVIRGAYHFFDPTEDGTAQAQHFLAVVGPLAADDLPPLLDLECPDGDPKCLGWTGGTGNAPAAQIRQRALDFLNTVQAATGKRPVIYTFGSYFSSNGIDTTGLAAWPLWIAYPTTSTCFGVPAPWSAAKIWQWSWTGSVAGIPGNVDRDRFLGTLAELQAFARGGSGATSFANAGKWLTGFGTPDWAAAGDFDGDGKRDVAWYEHWDSGRITVARSTGAAFANAGAWISGFGTPDLALVGDFNGDGKSDIAWYEAWNQGGSISIALSTGSSFSYAGKWLVGYGRPDVALVGDFDGDGKSDIAWYEQWNGGAVTILRSTGTSFVSAGRWITGLGKPDWAAAGDLDGDGRADLAWYEAWNGGSVRAIRSTGTALALQPAWATGLAAPDRAFLGDIDGDGRADLAWYRAGTVSVSRSLGSSFGPASAFVTGWGMPDWAALGDVDGDRRADLLWYEHWNSAAITVGLAR